MHNINLLLIVSWKSRRNIVKKMSEESLKCGLLFYAFSTTFPSFSRFFYIMENVNTSPKHSEYLLITYWVIFGLYKSTCQVLWKYFASTMDFLEKSHESTWNLLQKHYKSTIKVLGKYYSFSTTFLERRKIVEKS